jgi:hypothetical protein
MSKLSRCNPLMGMVANNVSCATIIAMEEYVGNAAAAEYVGIPVSAWRSYVTRTPPMAPEPSRRHVSGGHALPVWTRQQLDEWLRDRPGRGAPGRPRKRKAAA